ncbi:SAVED domain-containing protein, partial [Burkholderia multivorans]|uniref:SAVED domain-containing protein n=1 Tax=Burkholderia multivorans TaxID=87883 RepID=UPI001C26B4F7
HSSSSMIGLAISSVSVVPMPEVNSSPRKLTAPPGLFETVSKADIDHTIDRPYRHFAVRIAEPKRGVITHHEQASAIARAFREALDKIHNENPATIHHVFAATPMSVSFRLGQMVSYTMHRSVRAYNYSQRSTPPYFWAVDLVAADGQPGQLWISGE